MKRLLYFVPLLVAVALGGFAFWGLNPDRDPNAVPSVLISKPAPELDLPAVAGVGTPGFTTADLKTGEVILVNIFASWCGPCRAEHPVLTRMAENEGITLVGINYKDTAEDAAGWLEELGNPYAHIGADSSGRAAIELGVTGVPETFVVDGDGTILFREAGPVVGDGLNRLTRALEQARAQGDAGQAGS